MSPRLNKTHWRRYWHIAVMCTGTVCWLMVIVFYDAGSESYLSTVVTRDIGFMIEYLVNNIVTFCLFITLSPDRQPAGLFLRYPAKAFVMR